MTQPLRRPPTGRRKQVPIAGLLVLLFGTATLPSVQAAPVPDFSLQLLNGNTTSLLAHRGKPVLVNFFHSK